MHEIDKLAWVCVQDRHLLVARSENKTVYYIPGGKRDPGETDNQALMREINEELSVALIETSIRYANTFTAQAHSKPEGILVKITCYFADFIGTLRPATEVEEIAWVNSQDTVPCSAITKLIITWLKAKNIID
jgi:ADP-ribose pyrophosphatase YjhB (NUDIX family)